MAMSEMFGSSLLGFQQGLANQQARNDLDSLRAQRQQAFGSRTALEAMMAQTQAVVTPAKKIYATIREELQADVDEWLPKLAA